jgi:flavodoxin
MTVPANDPTWWRRPLPRRTVLLGAGAVGVSALAGCSAAAPPSPPAAVPTTVTPTPAGRSRTLLAYFSRPGENYHYGARRNLEIGNTEVVARMIADRLPIDVYRIEAADPYPDEYDATVERNVREQRDEARPALVTPPPSVAHYDAVLLGSPVWNVRAPRIMFTVLESWDLSGKRMLPFVTHAVSGIGLVADELTERVPGATVGEGLAVQGEEARQAGNDVDQWLRDVGLAPGD